MKLWIVAAAGLALAMAEAAGREGWVRTLGGERLEGEVSFAEGVVVAQPAGGEPVRVGLDELMELRLTPRVAGGEPETAPPEGTDAPDGVLPARLPRAGDGGAWSGEAIGPSVNGRILEGTEAWSIEASGIGLRGNADSAFLAQRSLEEAGQVLALLTEFDGTAADAVAGVTLRDNLGEAAAYAFLGLRAGSGISFQYRQIAGGMTMRVTNIARALPTWLRLSRSGGAVLAELSGDGREWGAVGRANINLGRRINAGAVVASGVEGQTVTAKFGNLNVGARGLGYVPATGYPRIILRGGSVLQGPIASADESVLRLGGEWSGALVSALNVARIEFLPLTPEIENRLSTGREGVAMIDGDFLDGRLRSIQTNQVTVSSLLLGYRKFGAGTEAAVVQMGPVAPEEAPFRLELEDGSLLLARTVRLGEETITAESPLLGSFRIKADRVRRLTRAAAGGGEL